MKIEINYKPLSREEELEAVRLAKAGNSRAVEKLLASIQPLIKTAAKQHQTKAVQMDDLFQEGILGAYKALAEYDETVGIRFSSYAMHQHGWVVKAMNELVFHSHLVPISIKDRRAGNLNKIVSFSEPVDQESTFTYAETIKDENALDASAKDIDMEILNILNPEARQCTELVLSGMDYRTAGIVLKKSHERVRQIHQNNLKKLNELVR